MDTRPLLDAALAAFGLPAVVTAAGFAPVDTEAFWLPPTAGEVPPGATFQRTERHRLLVLPLAPLVSIPRGTVIEMAEHEGGEILPWVVDSTLDADVDHHRVLVLPIEDS